MPTEEETKTAEQIAAEKEKAMGGMMQMLQMFGLQDLDFTNIDDDDIGALMQEVFDAIFGEDAGLGSLFDNLFNKEDEVDNRTPREKLVEGFFQDVAKSSFNAQFSGDPEQVREVLKQNLTEMLEGPNATIVLPDGADRAAFLAEAMQAIPETDVINANREDIAAKLQTTVQKYGGQLNLEVDAPQLAAPDEAVTVTTTPADLEYTQGVVTASPDEFQYTSDVTTTSDVEVQYNATATLTDEQIQSYNLTLGPEVEVTAPEFGEPTVTTYAFTPSGTLIETGEIPANLLVQGGNVQTIQAEDGTNIALHFEPKGSPEGTGYVIPIDSGASMVIDRGMAAELSKSTPVPAPPAPADPAIVMQNTPSTPRPGMQA